MVGRRAQKSETWRVFFENSPRMVILVAHFSSSFCGLIWVGIQLIPRWRSNSFIHHKSTMDFTKLCQLRYIMIYNDIYIYIRIYTYFLNNKYIYIHILIIYYITYILYIYICICICLFIYYILYIYDILYLYYIFYLYYILSLLYICIYISAIYTNPSHDPI